MAATLQRLYSFYERFTPVPAQRLLRPFFSDARTMRWFVLYGCIGATGVGIYLGLVWVLTHSGVPVLVATAVSFASGATAQFLLNRNLNFRAFHRKASYQARTYVLVMAVNFVLTLLIVYSTTRLFRLDSEIANLATLPVTFPVAYLCNRYLTFA